MSNKAALANTMLAESHNFNLERATQSIPNTILSYGAEFRSAQIIALLLQHHPNWNLVKDIITKGASYPLRAISEKDRLDDAKDVSEGD